MVKDIVIRDGVTLRGARVGTRDEVFTDGALVVQGPWNYNPAATRGSVPVAVNFDMSRIFYNLTTTALGAGSSYTSGSIDSKEYTSHALFIRTDQPMSIEIQESYDGSTFARSHVWYIGEGPGRTIHATIIFQLSNRYFRVVATNIGYATQTTFRLDRITIGLPSPFFISHYLATTERTTTALGANATYTSRTYTAQDLEEIGFYVYADQAGTVYYDVSFDGSTWRTVKSVSVSGGTALSDSFKPTGHFVRLRYVNGATAQTTFDFTIYVRNKA